MPWTVTEFPGHPKRILVCEADSMEELDELRRRAEGRGWALYADGTSPSTGRQALWLTKDAAVPGPEGSATRS